jgi:hypothetical protein
MTETILPDVYIDVRPEGLIVPGRVTVGRIGMVGTASRGPVGQAVILSSFVEAREQFGDYDTFSGDGSDNLTLVRALELAYANGATTVIAVRVAKLPSPPNDNTGARKAQAILKSGTDDCVRLQASTEGTWGAALSVEVEPSKEDLFVTSPPFKVQNDVFKLKFSPVVNDARNRIDHFIQATGVTRRLEILFGDGPDPAAGKVRLRSTGDLKFAPGDIKADDTVTATYRIVGKTDTVTNAVAVTVSHGRTSESYIVVNGNMLAAKVNDPLTGSALVQASTKDAAGTDLPGRGNLPDATTNPLPFRDGDDGVQKASYDTGLEALLNQPVQIIVAAGQDDGFGSTLDAHCQAASTDAIKRDRIAVVGSALGARLDQILGHTLSSDRVIFVAPGVVRRDSAANTSVTLPGAYAAAAVAGLLARVPAHVSPTNKTLTGVEALEQVYTRGQLGQLVENRVLALEQREGFRIVKGITTTDPPFQQITTRRIVDFAKFGVRSAAEPYIGLLNNERVRGALRATINSFLTDMLNAEMLVSYELDVTATRDEERKGIARVTIVLRPVFSIDFIQVTITLD